MSLCKGCSSGKGLNEVGEQSQHDEHDGKWEEIHHGWESKRNDLWHQSERELERETVPNLWRELRWGQR
jgi:hypothetical protein